jgi:O-antigen ligase
MNDSAPPVAARTDAVQLQSDANLHVQVGAPVKRFHLWVQGPAWLLCFAALGLGFYMVITGYDSGGGWFAVAIAIIFAVIASFRAPFAFGESAVSTTPGSKATSGP